MSQSLILSVSGLYTSQSDLQGIPPGSLTTANNVESRYKNTIEPRRGFEGLTNSSPAASAHFTRLTDFYISGVLKTVGLTSDNDWVYYSGSSPNPAVPGDYSTAIRDPDSVLAKSRFIKAGQNLYLTAQDGPRSLCSGSGSQSLRAGVPKALNIEAVTDGSTDGFFDNNVVLVTTGDTTNTSPTITALSSSTGLIVGQYIGGTGIPAGTKISAINAAAEIITQSASLTTAITSITAVASITGIVAGVSVSGEGIQEGTVVVSTSGGGPYTVVLSKAPFNTATLVAVTFTSALTLTLDQNATATGTAVSLTFYSGAQTAYRIVYGRVETDINGGTITRLGSPSPIANCTNTSVYSKNVTVTATLPKNSEGAITFYQLYRAVQTDSIDVTPLDQYNLVYETDLVAGDFTARVITITDEVPESLVGIPLYAGSDREGILQSNDPPPLCWDMGAFRDFTLFGNVTYPTTLDFTVVAVGAPSGIQNGDTITIAGNFLGTAFSQAYTAAGTESQATRQFKVFSAGTDAQNISDTVNSLIRVINYDDAVPVHAILVSETGDLPGQVTLEADFPSYDTFTATASAHTAAYDPPLTGVESEINTVNNGVSVSKSGELEAVPGANLLYAGDSSSSVIRVIPLRDYVIVIKSDGIYKLQGTTPNSLSINPFDITTKIIGPDTAVALNAAVWMLSDQGVVSISDGGVESRSVPIDDQINEILGEALDTVIDQSFAIAYESDRKYILSLPTADAQTYTDKQFGFNYATNTWATWTRNLHFGYINQTEDKMYIACADELNEGISKERKNFTYTDFSDEAFDVTIVSMSALVVTLSNAEGIQAGDVLYQSSSIFAPILEVDLSANTVTVQYEIGFTAGTRQVLPAYDCDITWKQVFGDNPAFMRQFQEGLLLFKNTRFPIATLGFATDFSNSTAEVELAGSGNSLWGLFPWGSIPWGGNTLPSNIRFYIPQTKQIGSYIKPSLNIRAAYSDFKLQAMSISYQNISQEVGR